MWAYIIMVGLITGAGYWILKPLLQENGPQNGYSPSPDDIIQQLNYKKEGAYATIQDLEFDLNMGKLSEEDFQTLKKQYLQEAAGYMKEVDDLKSLQDEKLTFSDKDIEEEIEQEVTSIPLQKSALKEYVYCAFCGEKAPVEDNFCAECGSTLEKGRVHHASHSDDTGEETIEKSGENIGKKKKI